MHIDTFIAFQPFRDMVGRALEKRAYEYIAYIDEAGDPGLSRVKPAHPNGSSEWLIVSAVVISRQFEKEIAPWVRIIISQFKNHQRRGIHFTDLNPAKKTLVCQELAKLNVRCFVIASNKKNMEGYKNPFASKVSMDVNWFYCWLTRLLLERVTYWVQDHSVKRFGQPQTVKLEYSLRGGLSYSQLNAYFELLRIKAGDLYLPMGNIRWPVIDRDQVEIWNHEERAGLQLADVTASAFFKACDVYDTGACDPRFAELLKPRIARDPDKTWGQACGFGLKLMPDWDKAALRQDQAAIFRSFGYPALRREDQWWDPDPSTL